MNPSIQNKTWLRHSVLIFLLLSSVGCAIQSSVVDLEDYTEKLNLHQRDLQARVEHMERQSLAPSVHVKTQQDFTASLIAQVSDIEAKVREFTGRVDESDHQISTLNNKIDADSFLIKALLGRISSLEKQRAAVKSSTGLSPTEAYNLAYNDYLKGNYRFADTAFDAFIKQYPESVLIPQAYYWKGELLYSEKSYLKAISAFKFVIQRYPKSEKIAESQLKIGFAFLEVNQPLEGKNALEKVLAQFPNSNEAFLAEDKLASLK